MKQCTYLLFFFFFMPTLLISQVAEGIAVVRPKETDSVLVNPGIGFNTFQHFNGDSLFPGSGWEEGYPIKYQHYAGTLLNKNHPSTSIAYWRVYWKFLEPEQGKYRWDLIDQALDSAKRRGQKLLLRIAPYGTGAERDVPAWYRKMVGNNADFAYNNPVNKWMVDPEDPRYVTYFGGMIRALGQRYNNHPLLEGVDLSIIGAWGEGAGSELLSQHTMEALIDAYTESFKLTPLYVLIMDEKTNRYANAKGVRTGWRADCLGDLGFWAKEQNGWTHMYDFYPQSIVEYGLQDVWKKNPVSFEICGTFLQWRDVQKYNESDVKYIFSEALKWHISSFNAKSSPVPTEWQQLVDEWLKKMGYRFVVKSFSYNKVVDSKKVISLRTWWENKGVAPCYENYPLIIRLKNADRVWSFTTDADIRNWLPGDNMYNKQLTVPLNLPAGQYEIQVGITDARTGKPVIRLAIDGRDAEGWYPMGKIRIL